MGLQVTHTPLEGVVVIDAPCYEDERGFFMEPWSKRTFAAAGLELEFVQEGHSRSHHPVVRGLHYQDRTAPMGKLVRCIVGRVFDVALDLRVSAPTFGQWFALELSADNRRQLYIPPGFAHGFATLSEYAEVQYKQTGFYTPAAEGGIRWDDPQVGITWPVPAPLLSARDQSAPTLADYLQNPAFP